MKDDTARPKLLSLHTKSFQFCVTTLFCLIRLELIGQKRDLRHTTSMQTMPFLLLMRLLYPHSRSRYIQTSPVSVKDMVVRIAALAG